MTISHEVDMRNEAKVFCHIGKQSPLTPSEVMISWLFAQESHTGWLMAYQRERQSSKKHSMHIKKIDTKL